MAQHPARQIAAQQRTNRASAALRRLTSPRKMRRPYFAARRIPQTFSHAYLRRQLLPLLPLGAAAIGTTLISTLPIGRQRQELAWQTSEKLSSKLTERAQQLYFENPGFDTLSVRALATHAHRIVKAGRFLMRAQILLGRDPEGRAATMIPLIPHRSYDALMVSALVVGTALGYLAGGRVQALAVFDSGLGEDGNLPLPAGRRRPKARRLKPARTLTDVCADIDDLYWADGVGQCVKITAVGVGASRRWVLALPGTAHMDPTSNANPADFESNVRETLNLPSGMRVGVLKAIHDAMSRAGVEDHYSEPVLIVGHSQGGMIATALASDSVPDSGVNVTGVLSLGSPNRRLRIRPDVTMVAVTHVQDIVPSVDGAADRTVDHRVTVERTLNRPRSSPLYYAHASMTYTETVRRLERRSVINPFDRMSQALNSLAAFLPAEGEECRVFLYDVFQEILTPSDDRTWNTIAALDRADWEPASFETTYIPPSLLGGVGLSLDFLSSPFQLFRKWWSNGQ